MKYYSYNKIVDFISRYKDKAAYIRVGMSEDWGWTACRVWDKHGFKIYASKEEASKIQDSFAPHRIGEDGVLMEGIDGSRWDTPIAIAYGNEGNIIAEEEVCKKEEV
jgi:hypothetical protein